VSSVRDLMANVKDHARFQLPFASRLTIASGFGINSFYNDKY
jgi:hypothetical protein